MTRPASELNRSAQTLAYFVLTVLGFSFWFFMAVPFASHRETYWWLATVGSENFAYAFSFISSTYRPLHQTVTWLAFEFLDPTVFPTHAGRHAVLQLLVYGLFVLAWWLIYSAAPQRRLFALVALVTGGVFFSGYVHLFHVYGLSYVPVMLMIGALLRFRAAGTFDRQEVWIATVATLLVFWHPFTTALFVGFCFGHYLESFRRRNREQHIRALAILLAGTVAVFALVVGVPRFLPGASPLLVETATRPLDTRLFAFVVSYQTNEVNRIATVVAFLLTQMVILSMGISRTLKIWAVVLASALSVAMLLKGVPLLLLWVGAALMKLLLLRSWSLFFLALTAVLLPFGGGIGTPIHALFAVIVAAYATPLGWSQAEDALSIVKPAYVVGAAIAAAMVLLMIRAGIEVPMLTRVARPLLIERERTYQLEDALAWLRSSDYCSYQIAFVQRADNPIDSVESALTRQHRPPASLGDVRLSWTTVLQCRNERSDGKTGTAIVSFGGPAVEGAKPVFTVKGRYADDATVWARSSQE
jgi:hypothetical protein